VSDPQIAQEVQAFIADHIESVVQLEVLLLLHANPQRIFSAADIATELRIDPAWAGEQLVNLCSRGILACTSPAQGLYRYGPRIPEMDRAITGLAQAYADRRVTVIGLIFSKPVDKIRSFADAFRLRKDKPPGGS
jgi:hypothetical protein